MPKKSKVETGSVGSLWYDLEVDTKEALRDAILSWFENQILFMQGVVEKIQDQLIANHCLDEIAACPEKVLSGSELEKKLVEWES